MASKEEFEKAAEEVTELKNKPSNDVLLELYSLYKQGEEGDVTGSRPGMMDIKGRAKFDARTKIKGMAQDEAMQKYVDRVAELKAADG